MNHLFRSLRNMSWLPVIAAIAAASTPANAVTLLSDAWLDRITAGALAGPSMTAMPMMRDWISFLGTSGAVQMATLPGIGPGWNITASPLNATVDRTAIMVVISPGPFVPAVNFVSQLAGLGY